MDSLHISLLVLGLVFVLSVQTGYGELQCYECNSADQYEGKDCEDKTKLGNFIVNCSDHTKIDGIEYKYCRKLTQQVDKDYRIVRQCAASAKGSRCVDRTGTKAIKITYCECEGNLCNSANSFSVNILLLTIISALLALVCHS